MVGSTPHNSLQIIAFAHMMCSLVTPTCPKCLQIIQFVYTLPTNCIQHNPKMHANNSIWAHDEGRDARQMRLKCPMMLPRCSQGLEDEPRCSPTWFSDRSCLHITARIFLVYVGLRLSMLWHVLVILFWCFMGPIFGDFWPQVGKAELFKIELSLWRRSHFAHFRCLLAGWRLAVNLAEFSGGLGYHFGSRCGQAGPSWGQSWAK